ncbi:histone-lysine N-methyltransferase PR-Set7 [Neocloeon triangulifer]|uniref:histone-lysine N-methyltransferase PR-Set7 n=1 Tax=Neocloeon triangulifer TaxID=2078957 RepID=UPI00286F3674|nr:histone-lysine N-methyltransferase PR-Set7 [Neocloeon triangulifer]
MVRSRRAPTAGRSKKTVDPQTPITKFLKSVGSPGVAAEVARGASPDTASPPHKIKLVDERPSEQVLKECSQRSISEFFPVRRSSRRPKKALELERQKSLEEAVLSLTEDHLTVCHFDGKGRGVIATRTLEKGELVVEYAGDLIDLKEARLREQMYAADQNMGCYMYYFRHGATQYCVDATAETGRMGRLVNHSRQGNLQTRTVEVKRRPRLFLVAKERIEAGMELLYDYGDRSRESLKNHPWLAS